MKGRGRSPLPIVWASHLIAMVPLAVIGVLTEPHGDSTGIAPTLAALALVPGAASLAVGRVALRGLPTQSVWILRWACAEAVAIVGLMVRFLGGPPILASALTVLGFVLVLAQYPRDDAAGG